jgi:hypothetical protein
VDRRVQVDGSGQSRLSGRPTPPGRLDFRESGKLAGYFGPAGSGQGDAANEWKLIPTGLHFFLRWGVGDLMSRGVPRWRF